jgi:disulfide bond formation protein DsbB
MSVGTTSASFSLPTPSRLGILTVLGSGALLLGALYFQYVEGLPPCDLCHWQRYPHIAAAGLGLLAIAAYNYPRVGLVLVMMAIIALLATAAIGFYHVGVEYRWWKGPDTCTGTIPVGLSVEQLKKYLFGAKMVRCDETAWSMWGVSMAGWNTILSLFLAFVLGAQVAKSVGRT